MEGWEGEDSESSDNTVRHTETYECLIEYVSHYCMSKIKR